MAIAEDSGNVIMGLMAVASVAVAAADEAVAMATVGGLRVLAPIDSYGVLLLGAQTSSPVSGFAGWAYHFSNGIGFGIAYAAVALSRRWWWGIGWGLVLETATLVTPFADAYGLRSQYGMIAVAYAAHVPYGLAGERGGTLVGQLREVSRRSTV